MNILLDTNILIRAEPTGPDEVEPGSPTVIELARLLNVGGHQSFIHPQSVGELQSDPDQRRRDARQLLIQKYTELPAPPGLQTGVLDVLGLPQAGSNDEVDFALLAAVFGDAVHLLVTDDQQLHRRAERLGIGDRVLFPGAAVAMLRGLLESPTEPPPAVRRIVAHEIDENDPIFASFEHDYPDFGGWLRRIKREQRGAWVIDRPEGGYAGICIVKEEDPGEFGPGGKTLKICTLKISTLSRGRRLGELLLRAALESGQANGFEATYITVFDRQAELLNLLDAVGFALEDEKTDLGELVLSKPLMPAGDWGSLSALEYHRRFGPRYFRIADVRAYLVPIQPRFHDLLFPELAEQGGLFPGENPFGNSLRKAYLCNASIRRMEPGDLVFFYRSRVQQGVTCIGVVEDILVSQSAERVARFVGQRTVYSLREICDLAQQPILAILFRQTSRVIPERWTVDMLRQGGVLGRAPQSIMTVREEGKQWIRNQIHQSP